MEGKEHHGQQGDDCSAGHKVHDHDQKDWSIVKVKEELEEVESEDRDVVMPVATNADEACQSQFDLLSSIEVVKEELDEYDEYQTEPLHALRPYHQDKKVKMDIGTQLDEACSSGYKIPDHDHKVKEKLEEVKSEDRDVVRPQRMSRPRAKRNAAGKRVTEEPSSTALGSECLPLSPSQLRRIWDFDNECGRLMMGAPLRTCTCKEEDDDSARGISDVELENLKCTIQRTWEKAKSIFEIFIDPKEPMLGYRLRVKPGIPIKVTVKAEDAFYFGWCANAPESSFCSHLYKRSPVKPNGYMGGPASYCNWAPGNQATMHLSRPATRGVRFLKQLECQNLSGGAELLWNYGCDTKMPLPADDWFLKCCNVPQATVQRHEKKQNLKKFNFVNVEKCVLCGEPFSTNNKEVRVQRKPHFVNSHANFLGSCWDGLKPYMQEEVSSSKVLFESDKLNCLLSTLTKDLKWHIIPACSVLSEIEIANYPNDEAVLEEFRRRCAILKAAGTLVLRGMEMVDHLSNLTINHLKPVSSSVWRVLKWDNGGTPPAGVYSVPSTNSSDHAANVQALIFKFCSDYLS